MSETPARYAAAPQVVSKDVLARRVGRGIAASVVCEQFAITDPVTEIPALLNIAFAAARHLAAAEKAMAGDDIAAYVTASSRLRELLEQFKGTESGDAL